MTNQHILYRTLSLLLCGALLLAGCVSRSRVGENSDEAAVDTSSAVENEPVLTDEQVAEALSMDKITADIDLPLSTALKITQPTQDITLNAETYYITGVSDPAQPLEMNGDPVESRGSLGSFGVFVELEPGLNTFVFTQGAIQKTINITYSTEETVYTTKIVDKMTPTIDTAHWADETYTLRCTAPSGGVVTAQIGDDTVELTQSVATDIEGVPAVFTAEYDPRRPTGTVDMGPVKYTLQYGGNTTEYTSIGKLYLVGAGEDLLVRAIETCSTVFAEDDEESAYYSVIREGAVDKVETIGADMYRLAMGGWVLKKTVEPLTESTSTKNAVTGAAYVVTGRRETLTLTGSANSNYRAQWEGDDLVLTLFRTAGVPAINIDDSQLFAAVTAAADGENTTLTMTPKQPASLWGYGVQYGDNSTSISFISRPKLAEGNQPLAGITIAVDPGHGGKDAGASGVAKEDGATEKQITLATAQAVERYLTGLGATVLLTRTGDDYLELSPRMDIVEKAQADMMISVHCNSIPTTSDGTGASGVEIYYFHEKSEALASALLETIIPATGRKDRGVRNGNYRITLDSYTPSVMVEMGFLTNPEEYDSLREPEEIYATAKAIGDGVVNLLQ